MRYIIQDSLERSIQRDAARQESNLLTAHISAIKPLHKWQNIDINTRRVVLNQVGDCKPPKKNMRLLSGCNFLRRKVDSWCVIDVYQQ